MPRIIGITGKKFNGKDTLGNYLSKYNYKIMAFADPLKEVIKTIFDFNSEQLYGEEKEKIDDFWKISPRTAMQFIGTDLFRHQMNKLIPDIGNEIWIKVIKRQIEEVYKSQTMQTMHYRGKRMKGYNVLLHFMWAKVKFLQ
jgi:dephospho-CoA kinase